MLRIAADCDDGRKLPINVGVLTVSWKGCSIFGGNPVKTGDWKNGATFGEVIKTFAQLQTEHRLCPNADEYDHDDDGNAHAEITARGIVDIEGIAETSKDRATLKRTTDDRLLRDARSQRLHRYIRAKNTGECGHPSGEPEH